MYVLVCMYVFVTLKGMDAVLAVLAVSCYEVGHCVWL